MNKKLQHLALTIILIGSSAVFTQQASAYEATLSGNAGILSEYVFRGITQDTASGNGGLDLEVGGFYLGSWVAEVDTGVEYDVYAGYVHEFANGFYLGAGATTYQFSDSFANEFNEGNLYAGWSNDIWSLDLEYTMGDYNGKFLSDTPDGMGGFLPEGDDYTYFAATGGWNGVYLTYGEFGDDAKDAFGWHVEGGYTFEVGGFEITGAILHTDLDDDPQVLLSDGGSISDNDETTAYVSIHTSFDIMKWGSGG